MISWCQSVYRYDRYSKKDGIEEGLHEYPNENYGMPIPPYSKGFKLFSESHLPEKITGVWCRPSAIRISYNADELKKILDRFVITRIF